MNIFSAILLGFTQGATEFLPISSSGHLVLMQSFLGFSESDLVFDVWLHLSTLLAVVIFFWQDLLSLRKEDWLVIFLSSIPAAGLGVLFSYVVEGWFAWTKLVVATLLVTGVFNFVSAFLLHKRKEEEIDSSKESHASRKLNVSWQQGVLIGIAQALAITPGISRSGSTVLAGLSQKMDRFTAFKFSFLLSIPIILGASSWVVIQGGEALSSNPFSLNYLLAGGTAFLTGLASLWLLKIVIKHSRLEIFGLYCWIVGLTYLFIF